MLLKKWASTLILFFGPFSIGLWADSPVFEISEFKDEYHFTEYLEHWHDHDGTATIESILSNQTSATFSLYVDTLKEDETAIHWGRVKIQNSLKDPSLLEKWFLNIGEGSYVDYWMVDELGDIVDYQKLGEMVSMGHKRIKTGNLKERAEFTLTHTNPVTVYIRLQKVNGHPPRFRLRLDQEDYLKSEENLSLKMRDWFFFGFLFTIIIFYLVLAVGTNDRTDLHFALFLMGIFIFQMDDFGHLMDMPIISSFPAARMYLVYIALAVMDISYLQFIRKYMDLDTLLPRWDRIYKIMIRVRLGYLLLVVLPYYTITWNEPMADILNIGAIFLFYAVVLLFLIPLYRSKEKKRAMFLAPATLLFIIGIFGKLINVADGTFTNRLVVHVAVISAVTVFSLGLAYRMRALMKEKREAQRLKDLDDLKTKLYANITHEFRTPLTVIQGMSETLRKNLSKKKDSRSLEAVELIKRNGTNLLNLVNQILDLSKLESGRMHLELRRGDMVQYSRYLLKSFDSFASAKNISLRFKSNLAEQFMDFDPEKIRQILTNLISNAIKYTPDGGQVDMILEKMKGVEEEELLLLSVKDSGQGIPKNDLPFIFDRYYQASNSNGNKTSKAKIVGTGIGLALTKELVELMGGEINVESKLGRGSTFSIKVPIRLEEVTEEIKADELQNQEVALPQREAEPEENVLAKMVDPFQGDNQPVLLIIEDNPDIVMYLSSLLEDEFRLEVAHDGKAGVDKAIEHVPDIIISDVMMPIMDGFEALEILKEDSRTSHIPVVMLTAKSNVNDRIAGLRRGADAYLSKPFEEEELAAILQNLKEQSARWQQYFTKVLNQPEKEESEQVEDNFIQNARQAVLDNISDEGFHGAQLQRAMGMGKTQLWRKLKALTGMSTSQFINYIRLQKAKEMLVSTSDNISEIAYQVGFKDPNYFTRLFVELYGLPPSEVRNRK